METNSLVSVHEAQKKLGIGKTLLYKFLSEGRLPAVKLHSRTFIKKTDLENFITNLQSYPVNGGTK